MKKTPILIITALLLLSCAKKQNPAAYVDNFIGTGGHGHTYPGATAPFGMIQLSPDTRMDDISGRFLLFCAGKQQNCCNN